VRKGTYRGWVRWEKWWDALVTAKFFSGKNGYLAKKRYVVDTGGGK